MVMEYLEGKSLSDLLKDSSISGNDTVDIAIGICKELELAHKSEASTVI